MRARCGTALVRERSRSAERSTSPEVRDSLTESSRAGSSLNQMSTVAEIEETGAPDDLIEVPIARDGTLLRLAVDTAIPIYLGRDLEVALLSYTARLEAEISRVASGGTESKAMRITGEILEVARVRMPPVGARELAMNLLRQLVENDLLAGDDLRHEIDAMISSSRHNDFEGS